DESEGEPSREDLYQPRGRRTRVFLASCIAAIAISVVGYFALRPIDPSWIWRSVESHYTALRAVMGEAPHETSVAQMAPAIVAPKAPPSPSLDPEQVQDSRIDDVRSTRQAVIVGPEASATPSLDPEQVRDFRIDDVRSARQADVTRLTSNTIKFSDHTTAGGIDSETALMPFAAWASSH